MISSQGIEARVDRERHIGPALNYFKPENFGNGGLPDIPDFFKLPLPTQTYLLLWENGCRVPYDSIIRNGLNWMRFRAGETNFFFSYILDEAKKSNKSLYRQLNTKRKRQINEPMPVGIYEEDTGPKDNDEFIYSMQRIFGYSPPRIATEGMGREGSRNQVMMLDTFNAIDKAIKKSKTVSEFIAILSNGIYHIGGNPVAILSHIFPTGILREQDCKTDYQKLALALRKHAPHIWKIYLSLNNRVLVQKEIAPINTWS